MASNDTLPPVLRVSDEDRDHVIDILRNETALGRLSDQTFVARVEIALQARGAAELAALLSDLPHGAAAGRRAAGPGGRLVELALGVRIRRARRIRRLEPLPLPRGNRAFVIGRSPQCDLTLADETVSWRHAELRWLGSEWVLADLGSTNGTHVNGWRAGAGFMIRPGDRVRFGSSSFVITS